MWIKTRSNLFICFGKLKYMKVIANNGLYMIEGGFLGESSSASTVVLGNFETKQEALHYIL